MLNRNDLEDIKFINKNGKEIKIRTMSVEHLLKSINLIANGELENKYLHLFEKELIRRKRKQDYEIY
jgi:hypothetical protein